MQVLSVLIQHSKTSLDRSFSYLYDGPCKVKPGCRVVVDFHHQLIMGYVDAVSETTLSREEFSRLNGFETHYIASLVDQEPLLNPELEQLCAEVADYYLAPKISVLQAMLPPSLKPSVSSLHGPKIAYEDWVEILDEDEEGLTDKQKEALRLVAANKTCLKKEAGTPAIVSALFRKGKIRIFKKEKARFIIPEYEKEKKPRELTLAQMKATKTILQSVKNVILLQGVTGSGKTEVYLKLSEEYLSQGKNILMLVPEISLTPIMVEYFSRRFEGNVAILHSELTPAEKYDEYRRIARGEARVVVGARSAVFAPLENIGLIILDEEHVESYKQDGLPYYHAREVAIMRAAHFGAKVVLGSATPSFETKARAMRGVYDYAELSERINRRPLPNTHIIDLRNRAIMMPNDRVFSKTLIEAIKKRLDAKEQVILLLNRRGYSSYVTCADCGHILTCPNCHANLTYHREDELLKCHHCGYVETYPETCPECGSAKIMRVGFGTERIVKVLQEYLPSARIGRLDGDVGKVRKKVASTLAEFRNQEYDILVGTQMIAKGHDFPNVTLVGLVLADIGLSLPSFRATESTFELITQAVGRSGRGEKVGDALIQSYNPFHYAVTLGAKQDYERFYAREMQQRKLTKFPPYYFLVALHFSSKDEQRCIRVAVEIKESLEARFGEEILCLGPVVPYYAIVGDRHKRCLLIKTKTPTKVKPFLGSLVRAVSGKGGIDIECDVDPLDY
ncbi:MAG: primosomal protein N' [Bacilli bacterium]|nr:primosomal protein N' [Bacilli bacterium]